MVPVKEPSSLTDEQRARAIRRRPQMKDDAKKILAKNLQFYMDKAGITQADIARRLHAQTSTVSYWCTGRSYPRPDAMQRLADMLSCIMSDLMSEHVLDASEKEENEKRDANAQFFDVALSLNEEGYKILLPIMKALASQPEYQRKSRV